MGRLFVSYSRRDRPFVERLAKDLGKSGHDVWIDVKDIRPGRDWSDSIQWALDNCDLMVLVVSPESMASENVADEWKWQLDRNKPLIPILLRPTQVHFQLNRIQYIDFNSQTYDIAFSQLCAELGRSGITRGFPPPVTRQPAPKHPPVAAPLRLEKKRSRGCVRFAVILTMVALAAAYALLKINGGRDDPSDNSNEIPATPKPDLTIVSSEAFGDGIVARVVNVGNVDLYEGYNVWCTWGCFEAGSEEEFRRETQGRGGDVRAGETVGVGIPYGIPILEVGCQMPIWIAVECHVDSDDEIDEIDEGNNWFGAELEVIEE